MVNGKDEINVRGSTSSSFFIVGPGGPDGVRLPCAQTRLVVRSKLPKTSGTMVKRCFFMGTVLNVWLRLHNKARARLQIKKSSSARPERDCAASQSQQGEKGRTLENSNAMDAGTLLRLVCDTAALQKMVQAPSCALPGLGTWVFGYFVIPGRSSFPKFVL